MGKKTTQFINKIQGEIDDLMEPLKTLIGIKAAYQDQKNAFTKLMEEMQEIDEKYVGGNKQGDKRMGAKGNLEQDLANDPQKKKLTAQLDKAGKEMGDTNDWMSEVKKDLGSKLAKLNETVKQFDAFITKKKSSWFGSKKSVPDAEKFIKDAKEASRSVLEAAKKTPA